MEGKPEKTRIKNEGKPGGGDALSPGGEGKDHPGKRVQQHVVKVSRGKKLKRMEKF